MTGAVARGAESLLDELPALPVVRIESVDFGKKELSKIEKALGLSAGRTVDLVRVDEGIRRLLADGGIQVLFLEAAREGAGLKIMVRGTKVRLLRNVRYEGIESEVLGELKRKQPLAEGEPADAAELTRFRDAIRSEYEARGYFAPEVKVTISEAEGESEEADVTFTVDAKGATRVGRVTITGGGSETEKARLRALIPLQTGDRYVRARAEEAVERINAYLRANQYPTSKVEGVNTQFSEDRLKVDLTFVVVLGPRQQFLFVGNTLFDEVALRQILTEELLSQADATAKVVALVEAKYKAIGYHFCRVRVRASVDERAKTNLIRFEIDEGPQVLIDELRFSGGGDKYTSGQLASLFYDGAPGVLARGVYWEEGMTEATQNLVRNLQSKGYLNASVSPPKTVFSEDKKGVSLFFDADLGTQTRVTGFTVKGDDTLSQESVEATLGVKVGDPLDREKLLQAREKLLRKYESEGYADVYFVDSPRDKKSEPQDAEAAEAAEKKKYAWIEVSTDQRSAVPTLDVVKGRKYGVGTVTVEGNRKTQKEVILREMDLKEGQIYDPAKVRRSEEKISLLGLFSRVEVVPSPNASDPNRKDLRIVVRETRPGIGEVGLGGTYEEPRLRIRSFLGLAYRNLGGLNQTVSARGEIALPISRDKFIPFIEYAAILGYIAPYPFQLPFTFSSQLGFDSYAVQEFLSNTPTIQTRARIEGKIERKFTDVFTGIYRFYRYERTKTDVLQTGASTLNSIGSIGPGVIFDFRNDQFNPTKGSYHTLDIELAHPLLLSQENTAFVMTVMRNTVFIPLAGPFSMTLFGGIGYAKSLFDGQPLPDVRLRNDLSLGGQPSIRGISLRILTPAQANSAQNPTETAYYNFRGELTTKLIGDLSVATFLDTGQIFPNMTSVPRRDGVGIGIRYKTPVGPLVIDIATALGPIREAVKFYFTVGTL